MKFAEKVLSIAHFVVLCVLIYWNYYTNTGAIDGQTVGSVSDQFDNLFTPAGFTFAIWGLIYLGLTVLAFYMLYAAFTKGYQADFVKKAAPPLILAHFGNAIWLWFWLQEMSAVSVLIMLFILSMLTWAVIRLSMEKWDAPLKTIALVWWPVDLYFGWICVATIANISAHLGSIGWTGGLSEVIWAVIAIALATGLGLFLIITRNMREVGAVIIWALFGIAMRHWGVIPVLQWTAIAGILILAVTSGIHAYQNRKTLPFIRQN